MASENLRKLQLLNISDEPETDSDSCNENVSNIKISPRKKRRLNVLSTLDSGEIENNNTQRTILPNIIWTTEKCSPKIHDFTIQNSGIQADINYSWKIINYFQLFVSEELVEYIAEKTNNYWRQKNVIADTELSELYCFIAVSFLMTRNKKLLLTEYWSKNKLLRSDIFSKIISRDRYLLLLQMLHFSDDNAFNSDPLRKIRNIIDKLRGTFANAFYPYRNLCIDETLLLYKGRLTFKQFTSSKRNRFGIKSFVLCDCKTGYIQDFIIHMGSGTMIKPQHKDIGKSGSVVMFLLEPYLGKGHALYVDNWCTSPTLFDILHKNGTNACGTVKKKRKGMPKMDEKLKMGEACFRSSENILAVKYYDKKDVYMISTMHTEQFVDVLKCYNKQEIIRKPACIHNYNILMGAVEKTDIEISTIQSTRETTKWYRKYFFYMIDMCLWNAYCLYKLKTGKTISIAKFQLKLIDQILKKYQKLPTCHFITLGDNYSSRLNGRHFPSLYKSQGKNNLRRCVVCSKNNKRCESRYQCEECDVGLCVFPCFKRYHTELYY